MNKLIRFFAFGLPFLLLLSIGEQASAQKKDPLPHYMTADEKQELPLSHLNGSARGTTVPPSFPVRTAAEWEEVQALVVTWTGYYDVLTEIVRHAKKEAEVLIICSDSSNVKSSLFSDGVNGDSLDFLERPYNSIWIRDYGPTTMYRNGVDSLKLMDWIYNRPRPDDDVLPQEIADHYGYELFETTASPYQLTNPGGNFIPDGMGTAFASNLVLEENGSGNSYGVPPKTESQIDSIMEAFMGIERYIKMETLPYDVIHHIDMHMKLLDEETLLVGEYPDGVADGPQIEANLQYVLDSFQSAFGDPFEVVRIPMPPDGNGDYPDDNGEYRTYTNSVFVNNSIIVPTYEEKYDTTALDIYREALPGYKVRGVESNDIIQSLGAIHCVTKLIGVEAPLRIVHQPLENTQDTINGYQVEAKLQHRSDIASATLYYTTDTSNGYQSSSMSLADPANENWSAVIPAQSAGETVYYYVEATANSGKEQTRPMPAPEGYWSFEVMAPSSLEDHMHEASFEVYPNPADAITCVDLDIPKATSGKVLLRTLDGRKVRVLHRGRIPQGEPKYFFDAEDLAPGSYLLVLSTELGRRVKKVMVE